MPDFHDPSVQAFLRTRPGTRSVGPPASVTLLQVRQHANGDSIPVPSVDGYGSVWSTITSRYTPRLSKEHRPLEQILGPAIIFEIENLFDARPGPALRHRLAHGLLSAAEFHDTHSIYACWFIDRLCCLSFLPHWQHVSPGFESP